MDNEIIKVSCTGSSERGHSEDDYRLIGLSPCKEYLSHSIDKSCKDAKDIVNNNSLNEPHDCTCAAGLCPCGLFISHKVLDPCPFEVIL